MPKVVVTSKIPRVGIDALEDAGFEVVGNPSDRLLTPTELKDFVKGVDGIFCLVMETLEKTLNRISETVKEVNPIKALPDDQPLITHGDWVQ